MSEKLRFLERFPFFYSLNQTTNNNKPLTSNTVLNTNYSFPFIGNYLLELLKKPTMFIFILHEKSKGIPHQFLKRKPIHFQMGSQELFLRQICFHMCSFPENYTGLNTGKIPCKFPSLCWHCESDVCRLRCARFDVKL